ncbi:CBR-LIN-24 protein [Ditylenchus destructor]|uniref:CBR-LIN-24 protein n=1 Tax=Ditylenchus destructor TaxID=166010 RepID=A0AAD4R6L0_9BILA|nr:CBR-LIN-24 protein [Ditylenchus destructor]
MKIYSKILLQTCFIDFVLLTFIGSVQPPTLLGSDIVWINRWHVKPQVGDIFAFLYPRDSSRRFIKRVQHCEGDMRKKRDGKVLFDLEPTHSRTEVKSSSTFESKIVFDKLHEGRVNKEPFKHVDVDELLEDYAWKMFKEAGPKKTSNLDQFKHMEKEHAAFTLNRKHLNLVHDDPIYGNVQKTGPRSSTIFKSVFTNYTSDKELFSSGNTLETLL